MPIIRRCLSIIIATTLLILVIPATSNAKHIYDNSGRISFEVSNKWYYFPMPDDAQTMTLLSIALDNNTAVALKQSKFYFPHKTISAMSNTDKSMMRDNLLSYYTNGFKAKGYTASLNKADYWKNSIIMGFTLNKNGKTYKCVAGYWIKDYICYSLCCMSTLSTMMDAFNAAKSLKVDNVPFEQWVNN